jgi:hypothetical protein
VLPSLNPVKAALLFLRRQIVEILQAIDQALLLLRRKLAELRIVLQSFLLVSQRQFAMRSEPISPVSLSCLWRSRDFSCLRAQSLRRTCDILGPGWQIWE